MTPTIWVWAQGFTIDPTLVEWCRWKFGGSALFTVESEYDLQRLMALHDGARAKESKLRALANLPVPNSMGDNPIVDSIMRILE